MTKYNKRPLPHSVTKKELINLYLDQMPERSIISNINEIILENRKKMPAFKDKTDREIKGSSKVFHVEFMEFVQTVGFPKGYTESEFI